MMDSNGTLTDNKDSQTFPSACDLLDLHNDDTAPSIYIGSSSRRIDHILGCKVINQSLHSSGSDAFSEGPNRIIEASTWTLINSPYSKRCLDPSPISSHTARSFKSGNPDAVETYHIVCSNIMLTIKWKKGSKRCSRRKIRLNLPSVDKSSKMGRRPRSRHETR